MPKVKYYQPVYQRLSGKKDSAGNLSAFTVNGACSKDRDEALSLGSKHVSVKNNEAKLLRVNETEVWED